MYCLQKNFIYVLGCSRRSPVHRPVPDIKGRGRESANLKQRPHPPKEPRHSNLRKTFLGNTVFLNSDLIERGWDNF